jgi:hypothetical protein
MLSSILSWGKIGHDNVWHLAIPSRLPERAHDMLLGPALARCTWVAQWPTYGKNVGAILENAAEVSSFAQVGQCTHHTSVEDHLIPPEVHLRRVALEQSVAIIQSQIVLTKGHPRTTGSRQLRRWRVRQKPPMIKARPQHAVVPQAVPLLSLLCGYKPQTRPVAVQLV